MGTELDEGSHDYVLISQQHPCSGPHWDWNGTQVVHAACAIYTFEPACVKINFMMKDAKFKLDALDHVAGQSVRPHSTIQQRARHVGAFLPPCG